MIGRDDELGKLSELLAERASGLVLLIGNAKIGKTSLLLALRTRALRAGWAVHPPGGDAEPLHVDPTTAAEHLPPVPQDGRELTGTVLLIHSYQPNEQFHAWFTTEYMPSLRLSRAPVLVVTAANERDVVELVPLARMILRLGPLPPVPVREHLRRLGQTLAEPPSEAELTAYVTAACESPVMLRALDRLLALEAELHPRAEPDMRAAKLGHRAERRPPAGPGISADPVPATGTMQ